MCHTVILYVLIWFNVNIYICITWWCATCEISQRSQTRLVLVQAQGTTAHHLPWRFWHFCRATCRNDDVWKQRCANANWAAWLGIHDPSWSIDIHSRVAQQAESHRRAAGARLKGKLASLEDFISMQNEAGQSSCQSCHGIGVTFGPWTLKPLGSPSILPLAGVGSAAARDWKPSQRQGTWQATVVAQKIRGWLWSFSILCASTSTHGATPQRLALRSTTKGNFRRISVLF